MQSQRHPAGRRLDPSRVDPSRIDPAQNGPSQNGLSQSGPGQSNRAGGPAGRSPQAHRQHEVKSTGRPASKVGSGTGGPLTALGVAVLLGGACLAGGALDLLLVGTAAWALTGLFLAACAYTAFKVRRSDWYSAVVAPPLAYALGLLLVAWFVPHELAQGMIGVGANMLELLALHAAVVFTGTGATAVIVAGRRLTRRL
jgi:hypothetical protein